MHRRALLAGIAATTGGIAGCLQSDGDGSAGAPGSDQASIRSSSIETTGTDCASGDADDATIDCDCENDAVTVTGSLQTSTPCYDAVLAGVAIDGQTLDLSVDAEEQGGVCTECIGEVQYEAVVEVDDADLVDEVVVEHAGGGTHRTSWDEQSTGS